MMTKKQFRDFLVGARHALPLLILPSFIMAPIAPAFIPVPNALAPKSLSGNAVAFTQEIAAQLLADYKKEKDSERRRELGQRILYFVERLNKIKAVLFDLGGVLTRESIEIVVENIYDLTKRFRDAKLERDKAGKERDIRPDIQRIFFSGKWAKLLRESKDPADLWTYDNPPPTLSFPEFVQLANTQLLKVLYLDHQEAEKHWGLNGSAFCSSWKMKTADNLFPRLKRLFKS